MARRMSTFALAAALLLSAVGCSPSTPGQQTAVSQPPTTTAAAAAQPTQPAATATAPSEVAKPTAPPATPTGEPAKATALPVATAQPTKPVAPTPTANPSGAYEKLLTVADVEQVSGIKGIKVVPYDPSKGAGGNLNFATQEGTLVVMANFQGSTFYQQSKSQQGFFKADVTGVGDEAFSGPAQSPTGEPYALWVRKGGQAFALSSFFTTAEKNYLSQDQLRELAKIVLSRL